MKTYSLFCCRPGLEVSALIRLLLSLLAPSATGYNMQMKPGLFVCEHLIPILLINLKKDKKSTAIIAVLF